MTRHHARSAEDRRVLAAAKREADAGRSWHEWYVHCYLCSEEWAEKRERVLMRDRYVCRHCRRAEATCVHHVTYRRVTMGRARERLSDMVALCATCHRKAHKIP
jgi:5-methylcytosine-specific restriction endonuclease McrA